MKWVTRERVHMDRVATPWLIKRFVDPGAEFAFIPAGGAIPEGHIPFGLPGVELGSHDEAGCAFRKVLRKYKINDPALDRIADIIESGIAHYFSKRTIDPPVPGALKAPEGIGLEAFSQGMLIISESDTANIAASSVLYDALYAFCRQQVEEKEKKPA
jgi:hypothetical protein